MVFDFETAPFLYFQFSNTGFSTISTVVVYAFIIVVTLTLRDVAKIESNHSHYLRATPLIHNTTNRIE